MRHARKMLEEMKLRDLGQFAAHMGFQLVPFFKKEQGRAAKTEEPVKALQSIHRDFEWPYPTSNSMSKRLLKEPRDYNLLFFGFLLSRDFMSFL